MIMEETPDFKITRLDDGRSETLTTAELFDMMMMLAEKCPYVCIPQRQKLANLAKDKPQLGD